jgi:hypothetical protein
MVSFALPQAMKTTVRALLLAALGVSHAGFSNPLPQSAALADSAAERQRQLIERIEQEESRNGPVSEALIAPLTSLALLHQESGDHTLAAEVIRRVQQVVRVNYGLHSLEQAPFIQQLIDHEVGRGNVEAAWELEQTLLTLARRHPEDLRTVPILRRAAESRLDVFTRYLAGELPPQIILGCYYAVFPDRHHGCFAGSRSVALGSVLSEAWRKYAEAIAVLLQNEAYASDQLREIEMELLRSFDRYRRNPLRAGRTPPFNAYTRSEVWRDRTDAVAELAGWDAPYVHDDESERDAAELKEREIRAARFDFLRGNFYAVGRLSLRRLLAYEIANESPPPARVQALVRLADWDLLYARSGNRKASALEIYEQAYELAREHGMAQETIDELFAPQVPVMLPSFLSNPLTAAETESSTGYIDVAFEIMRDGSGREIEILDLKKAMHDAGIPVRL